MLNLEHDVGFILLIVVTLGEKTAYVICTEQTSLVRSPSLYELHIHLNIMPWFWIKRRIYMKGYCKEIMKITHHSQMLTVDKRHSSKVVLRFHRCTYRLPDKRMLTIKSLMVA